MVSELGDSTRMARGVVAATSQKLCSFLDKQLNNLNSSFFVATNRHNPVDEWTAIMRNIFDTNLVDLIFRTPDQLGNLVDLANSEGFQNLPQSAVLDQYKTWLDHGFRINTDPKHSSPSVLQKLYLFIEQPAFNTGIPKFLHFLLCWISHSLKLPWTFTLVHGRSGISSAQAIELKN